MRFLKENSTIPVPWIYGYDDDHDGRVGGKFLVMEYVRFATFLLRCQFDTDQLGRWFECQPHLENFNGCSTRAVGTLPGRFVGPTYESLF